MTGLKLDTSDTEIVVLPPDVLRQAVRRETVEKMEQGQQLIGGVWRGKPDLRKTRLMLALRAVWRTVEIIVAACLLAALGAVLLMITNAIL